MTSHDGNECASCEMDVVSGKLFVSFLISESGVMDEPVVFVKSNQSGRWWMKMPAMNEQPGAEFIPCSYRDYHTASKDEIPDRLLQAIKRQEV